MKTNILDSIVVSVPGSISTSSIGLHALEMSNWLKDRGLVWGKITTGTLTEYAMK